jgi:hypothetical protein
MRLTLGINLDNAAFVTKDGELDRDEVSDTLEQVENEIRYGTTTTGKIRDRNGHRIGSWVITP